MSPTYRMPDEVVRRRAAVLEDIHGALAAARCAVELAGSATNDFVVRELLVRVIQEIDRAAASLRRLV